MKTKLIILAFLLIDIYAFGQTTDELKANDVEINGNQVTVMFPAGTEKIEILGTFVVPEFGSIAALILVVAIVSVIAISARSRLSLMPKF